jgi:hypothetical protein
MTEKTTATAFEQELTALAESRGLKGLDELKDRLRAAGHNETADTLLQGSPGGFGQDLDEVLRLTEGEKTRVFDAFASTFIGIRKPEEDRAEIFDSIVRHLDYVASIDEEIHGGSYAAQRIRETLIPFCLREGGLEAEEVGVVDGG